MWGYERHSDVKQAQGEVNGWSNIPLFLLISWGSGPSGKASDWEKYSEKSSCVSILAEDSWREKQHFLSSLTFNMTYREIYKEATTTNIHLYQYPISLGQYSKNIAYRSASIFYHILVASIVALLDKRLLFCPCLHVHYEFLMLSITRTAHQLLGYLRIYRVLKHQICSESEYKLESLLWNFSTQLRNL